MNPSIEAVVALVAELGIPEPRDLAQRLAVLLDTGQWALPSERARSSLTTSLNDRFATRQVVAIARRTDCDDVACLVVDPRETASVVGEVLIVHDHAEPGTEVEGTHESLDHWLSQASPE